MNENDKQSGGDGGNNWMKNLVIWVGILVALALVVSLIGERGAAAPGKSLSYSAFLNQVKQGTVAKVEIAGTVVNGTMKDNSTFRTNLPAMSDPQLMPALTAANVDVVAKPEEQASIWQYLLVQSLPFVLMLAHRVLRAAPDAEIVAAPARWDSARAARKMLTEKHGKRDLRRRRRHRRSARGIAGDRRVPEGPDQVRPPGRQDPQGRAAGRLARHRQDAARPRDRG